MVSTAGGDTQSMSLLEERIASATMRCIARWGVSKTTLDDVAREAGCSRATIYRVYPGGKDVVFLAAAAHEANQFYGAIDAALGEAATLEDALVIGMVSSAQAIKEHPALQYLIAHEPETVLPFIAFDGLDPVLVHAAQIGGPHLARFVDDRTARELGELVARLVVAYTFDSSSLIDLTQPDTARRMIRTYVLAGVETFAPTP